MGKRIQQGNYCQDLIGPNRFWDAKEICYRCCKKKQKGRGSNPSQQLESLQGGLKSLIIPFSGLDDLVLEAKRRNSFDCCYDDRECRGDAIIMKRDEA